MKLRFIILSVVLLFCGVMIQLYFSNSQTSTQSNANLKLEKNLYNIPNWQYKNAINLRTKIVESLQLDEYVNARYTNKNSTIALYIGQYHSTRKVEKAHKPLVCYPGQGWEVSNLDTGTITISNSSEELEVSYSTLVTKINNNKRFVLYWFQSLEQAFSTAFQQKITTYFNTILNKKQYNAFIRIDTSLNDKSLSEARKFITQFVKDFYPIYIKQIRKSS